MRTAVKMFNVAVLERHFMWHSSNGCNITTELPTTSHRKQQQKLPGQQNSYMLPKQYKNSSMYYMHKLLTLVLLSIIFIGNNLVEGAIRNVNLIIEPPAVRRGQHAILRCLYVVEGAPLYSAKFYRGQLEFYRYTPGEFPNAKVFPFAGIHVDITNSNATQVLIRNVGFGLSGNFSCEVTADAPLFSTATAVGTMQVVELPEKQPDIFTENKRYEPGDVLRANCSTPPSRPQAELKFTINNMVVPHTDTQYIRTPDNLIASHIYMKLQLQAAHFTNGHSSTSLGRNYNIYNGQMMNSVHGPINQSGSSGSLILRCTAQIGDFYQEYSELELGTPQKDPIPASMTHSSGSSMANFWYTYFSSGARLQVPPMNSYLLTAIVLMSTAVVANAASSMMIELFMDLYGRFPEQQQHRVSARAMFDTIVVAFSAVKSHR